MKTVVIGKSSFLATEFGKIFPQAFYLSHDEISENKDRLIDADCVINFALSPSLRNSPYTKDHDIDSHVAGWIANSKAHYIMLSSRMVYGQTDAFNIWSEQSSLNPTNQYGQSKLEIEHSLKETLPEERLTILRLGNIFGFEYGRSSFFGRCLSTLKSENKIIYDMSGETKRDFVPVSYFAGALKVICENPVAGTFNLGSGLATPCQDIASNIIEGFGQGELQAPTDNIKDQFVLDMTKARANFVLSELTAEDIKKACQHYGELLRTI